MRENGVGWKGCAGRGRQRRQGAGHCAWNGAVGGGCGLAALRARAVELRLAVGETRRAPIEELDVVLVGAAVDGCVPCSVRSAVRQCVQCAVGY